MIKKEMRERKMAKLCLDSKVVSERILIQTPLDKH